MQGQLTTEPLTDDEAAARGRLLEAPQSSLGLSFVAAEDVAEVVAALDRLTGREPDGDGDTDDADTDAEDDE